jgi:hypothetical protein
VSEDRPWLGDEPTGQPDPSFRPGPTGLGVFFAVAAPIVFAGIAIGVRRDGSPIVGLMVAGVAVGLLAGALVALVLSRGRERS